MDSSWSKGESSIQHISTRIREGDKASCTQLTFYVAAHSLSIQLHISNTYINAYVRIPTHILGVGGIDKNSTCVFFEKILRYYYIPTIGVADLQAPLNNMLPSS